MLEVKLKKMKIWTFFLHSPKHANKGLRKLFIKWVGYYKVGHKFILKNYKQQFIINLKNSSIKQIGAE